MTSIRIEMLQIYIYIYHASEYLDHGADHVDKV